MNCEYIPDAYEEIMACAGRGEIVIQSYENMTPAQRKKLHEAMISEYEKNPDADDYRHFIRGKFPFVLEKRLPDKMQM